jgi:dimethylaniline monooxygenase (N-oxide forming)
MLEWPQLHLPSASAMLRDIQVKREEMRSRYVPSLRHTLQVDYIDYGDELADLIGCRPSLLATLVRDPEVCAAPPTPWPC